MGDVKLSLIKQFIAVGAFNGIQQGAEHRSGRHRTTDYYQRCIIREIQVNENHISFLSFFLFDYLSVHSSIYINIYFILSVSPWLLLPISISLSVCIFIFLFVLFPSWQRNKCMYVSLSILSWQYHYWYWYCYRYCYYCCYCCHYYFHYHHWLFLSNVEYMRFENSSYFPIGTYVHHKP